MSSTSSNLYEVNLKPNKNHANRITVKKCPPISSFLTLFLGSALSPPKFLILVFWYQYLSTFLCDCFFPDLDGKIYVDLKGARNFKTLFWVILLTSGRDGEI